MSWSNLVSGDSVEVLSDEEGHAATWRPARIIHPFIARPLYFVVFDKGAVRVTVSADRVRPKPPATAAAINFELGQPVDVLADGVWSPGLVSEVHVLDGERRYRVRIGSEEVEVGSGEIRIHMDWVNGKWVSDEKGKSLNLENLSEPKSDSQIDLLRASDAAHKRKVHGSVIPLSGDEHLHQPLIFTPKAEIQNAGRLNFESKLRCFHPCKKAKKEEDIEDATALFDLRATEVCRCAEFSTAEKMGFDICTPIVEEKPNFHIKALVEKIDAVSGGSVSRPSSTLMENPSEKASQEISLLHKPRSNNREVLSKERPLNSEFLQSAEWCQYIGPSCPIGQRKKIEHEGKCQRNKGVGRRTLREKTRKNSRPQKLRLTAPSFEADSAGNQQKIPVVGEPKSEGLPIAKCSTCAGNDLEAQEQCNSMAGSSDFSLIDTSVSDAQFSEAGSKSQDDVLLSNIESQFTVQGQLQLPFEKCSSMWDSIESMKTFSLMPQHPHFLPLQRYRKDFREGIAIGLMVTFCNLVNYVTKLQISDSRDTFDDMLKTLGTLELHGFDVLRLKSRLVDLQRLKDDREQLVDEKMKLEVTLVKKESEKKQLNAEYESIGKAVKELQQSLSRLCEFRSSIFEGQRERDSKLENLETESRKVANAILAAKHEFEATLSAKW